MAIVTYQYSPQTCYKFNMSVEKPLGGRGKKEQYTTYIVRVPESLKPQIEQLVDKFHATRTKPFTGNTYQIPASLVCQMLQAAEPIKECDIPPSSSCSYPRQDYDNYCSWPDDWDITWTEKELPKLIVFNQLADQVNLCIWQIDNTFAITSPDDARDAGELLVEYGLVQMDKPTLPATAKALFDWVIEKQGCRDCYRNTILDAFEEERFDMLTALEVGQKHPVNRVEYWHTKYTELLAKPKINYWGWLGNPESKDICPELSQLLELPAALPHARMVLECLAEGKDPFYTPETNGTYLSFAEFLSKGDLANYSPEMKKLYRQAFTKWHLNSLATLGQERLAAIYKVVYKTNWDLIESIVSTMSGEWWEVLAVSPLASSKEVKSAYRRMAAVWHPDLNSSPKAAEYMIKINQAFEQYEKTTYRYR